MNVSIFLWLRSIAMLASMVPVSEKYLFHIYVCIMKYEHDSAYIAWTSNIAFAAAVQSLTVCCQTEEDVKPLKFNRLVVASCDLRPQFECDLVIFIFT